MRTVTVDQLASALESHAVVIDVREAAEFAAGHVPGAVNIPMGRLAGAMGTLDHDALIHVVCRSGNRSGAMTDLLTGSGFEAVNVTGGTDAWIASGRPVEGN